MLLALKYFGSIPTSSRMLRDSNGAVIEKMPLFSFCQKPLYSCFPFLEAQCPGRRWKSNKRCCRIHHISQLLPGGPLVTATKTHFHAGSALDRWIKDIKWNLNVENCIWDYERLYEIAANLLPCCFRKFWTTIFSFWQQFPSKKKCDSISCKKTKTERKKLNRWCNNCVHNVFIFVLKNRAMLNDSILSWFG